ncbi:MAG: TetR/AcrR family transcriptional regulator [Gammaproteobacteria bacterium]|nr:TetR/AcrR family transcriptional regulator [Gammaproteobacteria bacterium]
MAKETYHHGNLRAALLDAAERLLGENGVTGVSLRAVAKEAGVSHTAPYRHFQDKQSLLAALAEIGFARLRDAMYGVIDAYPEDPRRQLVESAAAYVRLATSSPEMNHLMFGGALPEDAASSGTLQETAQQAFQGLLDIIGNGIRAGLYVERPPLELASTAWSLVHGLAMLVSTGKLGRRGGENADPETLARRMAEHLLEGITAR